MFAEGTFVQPPVCSIVAIITRPTDANPRYSVPRAVHRAGAPRTHPGALVRPLATADATRGSIATRLGCPKPSSQGPRAAASVGGEDSTRSKTGRRAGTIFRFGSSPGFFRVCNTLPIRDPARPNPRRLFGRQSNPSRGSPLRGARDKVGARESRSRFGVLRVARATE